MAQSVSIVLALVWLITCVRCYKVLVVFPIPSPSHGILGAGYVRELLKKGHEVTYISPFSLKEQKNFAQVQLKYNMTALGSGINNRMNITKLLTGESDGDHNPLSMHYMLQQFNELVLSDSDLQTFLRDPSRQFDVVVAEWFFSELSSGYAALYQCPLVWSSSLDIHSMLARIVDEPPNPAYFADSLSHNIPPFNFWQRMRELWILVQRLYVTNLLPKQAKVYSEIFGPAAARRGLTLPPYEEIIYNSSLVLTNAHPSLGDAPKLPQNVKAIDGYHVDMAVPPLPQDLQKIMDESNDGVIYFSMGSNVKSNDIPNELKNGLVKLFGNLKQTVLWKFDAQLTNLPKNLYVKNWFPQPSILTHLNTKIFITHGGLLSVTESIHYGVPIIGVPLFGDQFLNMERSVKKGFALNVHLSMNLASELDAVIEELLQNDSYAKTAMHLSTLYHDRPTQPGDDLVYWIEHVVRSGGAIHLRSAARLVRLYQKLYLDLLGLVLGGLAVLWLFAKKVFRNRNVRDSTKKRN